MNTRTMVIGAALPSKFSITDSGRNSEHRNRVHIMINTALTGATYGIDGGQQFAG
jgi:hypothetical protein